MTVDRNVYLNMKTLDQARNVLIDGFAFSEMLSAETVSAPDAVNRVLAEPVVARLSSPAFHSAAMDGIAVQAEDTFGGIRNQSGAADRRKKMRFMSIPATVLPRRHQFRHYDRAYPDSGG